MSPDVPKPSATSDETRRVGWCALVLALGTLALFAPVRNFGFVNFDDDAFVFANDMVRRGFTWEGVKWAFLSADIDYWRPLSWLSHMMDVELFGLRTIDAISEWQAVHRGRGQVIAAFRRAIAAAFA